MRDKTKGEIAMKALKFTILCLPVLFVSCLISTQQIIKEVNEKNEEENRFQQNKFKYEFNTFRFKHNILELKIGVLVKAYRDNKELDGNNQQQTDLYYNMVVSNINEINNEWENIRIDYFQTTEEIRSNVYNELKSEGLDFTKLIQETVPEKYKEMDKRFRYYIRDSDFYKSQKAFDDYIKNRSYVAVDRSQLKNILGEYGLSQSGLTKYQIEQLELYDINFLFVVSMNLETRNFEAGSITKNHITTMLIYVKTSEIVASSRIYIIS